MPNRIMTEGCPICLSKRTMRRNFNRDGVVDHFYCIKCWFRCDVDNLEKITAAMDLAREEAEMDKTVQLAARGYIKANYFSKRNEARNRVIEVFGG